MRKHNGMRPQDVAILLKICQLGEASWKYADLAQALQVSQSEIAEGLNRSRLARLVDPAKRKVFRESFVEFISYGFKYVFPVQPGAIVRGIPTAHSAMPLSQHIVAEKEIYVWPSPGGPQRGQSIQPLYAGAVKAALADPAYYELLALLDAVRAGRPREVSLATEMLHTLLMTPEYAGTQP